MASTLVNSFHCMILSFYFKSGNVIFFSPKFLINFDFFPTRSLLCSIDNFFLVDVRKYGCSVFFMYSGFSAHYVIVDFNLIFYNTQIILLSY